MSLLTVDASAVVCVPAVVLHGAMIPMGHHDRSVAVPIGKNRKLGDADGRACGCFVDGDD